MTCGYVTFDKGQAAGDLFAVVSCLCVCVCVPVLYLCSVSLQGVERADNISHIVK